MGANKIDLTGDGGVIKEIVKEGLGDETPMCGHTVVLHYVGKLTDGTEFDSSVKRNQPFQFSLGKGNVIKGFDCCVASMKLKEECILTCSPEYAYGENGSPPSIPPNATLIFELNLLAWKGEDVSPELDGSIERTILEFSEKRRKPQAGAFVKAHICGEYNGKVFEDREVAFNLYDGANLNIIKGVEYSIEKMRVGEKSRFLIKSKHAFGAEGNNEYEIPPNADVTYTIKLFDCEKAIDEWRWSNEERLEQAKLVKEKGTNYFKKNNFSLALKMYTKAATFLQDHSEKDSNQEIIDLRIAAHNNCALCHQKLTNYFEGKKACDEVLKLDPNNIKALFRRGQCNLIICSYEEALSDFQKVSQLDPSNRASISQISICKTKIKEFRDKEKKIYKNMFQRLAVHDKEVTIQEPDILTKCGEWSEEDTKREADLAFECDDIFMI